MFEIRVHGLGGQGAVTMVTWVARVGYAIGKYVQAFPFFGAERRGAPVKAFVRIDDEPINLRSQIYRPDILLVMSPDLVDLGMSEGIKPAGRLLVNAGEEFAERTAARLSRDVFFIDATGIAIDLGLEYDGMPMVNVPIFAATVSQAELAPFELVMEFVEEVSRRGDSGTYKEAARRGFEGVGRAAVKESVP